jgi:hypothetical protein
MKTVEERFDEYVSKYDDKTWSRLNGMEYRVAQGAWEESARQEREAVARRCVEIASKYTHHMRIINLSEEK